MITWGFDHVTRSAAIKCHFTCAKGLQNGQVTQVLTTREKDLVQKRKKMLLLHNKRLF